MERKKEMSSGKRVLVAIGAALLLVAIPTSVWVLTSHSGWKSLPSASATACTWFILGLFTTLVSFCSREMIKEHRCSPAKDFAGLFFIKGDGVKKDPRHWIKRGISSLI